MPNAVFMGMGEDFSKMSYGLCHFMERQYGQPWRAYHNLDHIDRMWTFLQHNNGGLGSPDRFIDALLWHDVICEPGAFDNEKRSAELFMAYAARHPEELHTTVDYTVGLIMATANPRDAMLAKGDKAFFVNADWNDMAYCEDIYANKGEYIRFLDAWDDGIFKEHSKFPIATYLRERILFLKRSLDRGLLSRQVADYALQRMRRTYRVGVFAGSFSPFHNGHLDIYNQACAMFDKVVIAIGQNPDKPAPRSNAHDVLPYAEVVEFDGQLVDLMHSMAVSDEHDGWSVQPVLVRGIRNAFDQTYEDMFVRTLRDQCRRRGDSEFPIVHLLCRPDYAHVSSTLCRGLQPNDREMYVMPKHKPPSLEIDW